MQSVRSKKFFSVAEWVVIVAAFLILIGFWLFHYSPWSMQVSSFFARSQSELAQEGLLPLPPPKPFPPSAPPYTNEVQAQLAANPTFQLVISYTGNGFEPSMATIKQGQTIRFTNNTTEPLWISASGTTLYPAASGSCAQSAFDSCAEIAPGAFWEFTFSVPGSWNYENELKTNDAGMIKVK